MQKGERLREGLAISHQARLIRGPVSISGQALCLFHHDPDVGVDVCCAGGVQGHISNVFKVSVKSASFGDVVKNKQRKLNWWSHS